jgi:protein-disulfide isomerase
LTSAFAALALLATGTVGAATGGSRTDSELLRFVERALPWCPDSSYSFAENAVRQTPSGSYRLVSVERTCSVEYLNGTSAMIIDELAGVAWIGSRGQLKAAEQGVPPTKLREFVEGFLPEVLRSSMGVKVRVGWDAGSVRAGAMMPMRLRVDSGYGEYFKPGAVTADGEYLILGAPLPMDKDPVAYRRAILGSSPDVVWDHPYPDASVEIVEFSDFECPGCRKKWPLIEKTVQEFEGRLQHGQVSFPLTSIHPWAFRAASATWCVAQQKAPLVSDFKELFYSMQTEMEVALVTPTARDFVAAESLDELQFGDCYLKQPSLDGVHSQMTLGHSLGVSATPTYYVNGWLVVAPDRTWLGPMIERLAAGTDP